MQNTSAKTPTQYMAAIPEPRRAQVKLLDALIKKTVPSLKPTMQSGMLGYGPFRYVYASGRSGDWVVVALANQKNYISLYVCAADGKQYIAEKYADQLPKASIGKSCIRFRKVEDIDLNVIRRILKEAEKLSKKPGFMQPGLVG